MKLSACDKASIAAFLCGIVVGGMLISGIYETILYRKMNQELEELKRKITEPEEKREYVRNV